MSLFKPGDIVRFREWEDMKSEFGTGLMFDLATYFTFSTVMRPLCGLRAEVTSARMVSEIRGIQQVQISFIDEIPEMARGVRFSYSSDMFVLDEVSQPDIDIPITEEDVLLILGG